LELKQSQWEDGGQLKRKEKEPQTRGPRWGWDQKKEILGKAGRPRKIPIGKKGGH